MFLWFRYKSINDERCLPASHKARLKYHLNFFFGSATHKHQKYRVLQKDLKFLIAYFMSVRGTIVIFLTSC